MKRFSSTVFHGFFLPLLMVCSLPVGAQYYSMGADPSMLKWNQTKVRQFNLIYPKNEIKLASRFSGILNIISGPVVSSMQSDIRYLPIILHPYTSFSNGSSILAPRRIELYPKQPIALETNDFSSQLVIHEVRHFAQMERLNTGVTRIAGYLMGEQAQSLVMGIHVPTWLLEGDAVLTETLLSHAGRGRIAGFIQPLRSRLIDSKDLSWDRVWFGSYNEVLPNEYLFGYFLTARGRMLADPLVWSDALEQIGRNPFLIKGISGITRPKTGFRLSNLYVETLEWLRDYWTDPSLSVQDPDSLASLSKSSCQFLNYYRPQRISGSEVISLKRTLANLPAFVIIDTVLRERKVARPGTMEDSGFSCSQGNLVWAEMIQDPRWENRSWSELFKFNLATHHKTRLTHRQRYFSPVFSPDGKRIAVISEKSEGSSYINLLHPADGTVLMSMPEARNNHFSYLCWGKNSDEVFAITTGNQGRKIILINFKEMVQEVILDAGFVDITSPVLSGSWLYFTGPSGATQGLYRIDPSSHQTELVFKHPHGINYLSTSDKDLLFSAYSANGYRPMSVPFSSLHGKPVKRIEPLSEPVTSIIQRANGEFPLEFVDTFPMVKEKRYYKLNHLFRLHSWSPVFVNPGSYQISPGVVLMSQNDLSTLTCWTGYQYIKTDRSQNFLASARYTGLYPVFQIDYSRKYRNSEIESGPSRKFPGAFLQFFRLATGIPLDYSSGSWNRKVEPTLFFEQVSFLTERHSVSNNSAWMTGVSLSADILRKLSYRDLYPKWGFSVDINGFKAFSQARNGNDLTGRIIFYLPGFLPNSSLRVLNSASKLTFDQFLNSLEDFPRGQVVYQVRNSYNLKIDYAFPIAYPDYHLSWLIYIKRIKADLFFDAGTSINERNWFMSTGTDLTMDYHLVRLGMALESGVRLMYFPTMRKIGAEFLFSFAVK